MPFEEIEDFRIVIVICCVWEETNTFPTSKLCGSC
jgi:hypothetical protein